MLRHGWYRFVGWFGTRAFVARLHPPLYRWTGGRGFIGHPLGRLAIVLTTIGAARRKLSSSSMIATQR